MFRSLHLKGLFKQGLKGSFVCHCDGESTESSADSTPSLIEQADAVRSQSGISPPMQYENIKSALQQGTVNTYDGFRMVVQKQVNLNTVVSHFFWLGSQATGQPIYQYRIILPISEDKMVNVASDLDFNVEGEVRAGEITRNISAKSNFVVGEQQQSLTADLDYADDNSTAQLQCAIAETTAFSLAYMQSLSPTFSMGGMATYGLKSGLFDTAFAGVYATEDDTVIAQWDNNFKVMYLRKVNPNRVHLCTDLTIDEKGESQMGLSAEYMLKQGKLQLSVDSNLLLRTFVETSVVPGVQLQLSAEMQQAKGVYRFGYGFIMM